MAELYSRRNTPPPSEMRYDIPVDVRRRFLATFQDHVSSNGGMGRLLDDVGSQLIKAYGGLFAPGYEAARVSDHPVVQHFFSCDHEHALDFIECCFRQFCYSGGQQGVDEINGIFRDHGIGYELTPYIEHHVEREHSYFGRRRSGTFIEHEFPRIIRRDSLVPHEAAIEPALRLLTDSRLRAANHEYLKGLSAIRAGEPENGITLCCSAFESFLRTICEVKDWKYDREKDTCSRLIDICRDNGLMPSFYCPMLTAVGTVRNKIGSAHGRGPTPTHCVGIEHAEHLAHVVASHILFLARLAGLQ